MGSYFDPLRNRNRGLRGNQSSVVYDLRIHPRCIEWHCGCSPHVPKQNFPATITSERNNFVPGTDSPVFGNISDPYPKRS